MASNEGYLMGLLVGDGSITEAGARVVRVGAYRPSATATSAWADRTPSWPPPLDAARRCNHQRRIHRLARSRPPRRVPPRRWAPSPSWRNDLGLRPGRQTITPAIERGSSEFYRGFLRGLFDSEGSVQGTQAKGVSIRLGRSDTSMLEGVQRMLLRRRHRLDYLPQPRAARPGHHGRKRGALRRAHRFLRHRQALAPGRACWATTSAR